MDSQTNEFPRPHGVIEWIGTVIGLLIGGAIVAVAIAAVIGAIGLLVLPVLLITGDPWWWAPIFGAALAVICVMVVLPVTLLDDLEEEREAARQTGGPVDTGGPFRRAAGWLADHQKVFYGGLLLAILLVVLVLSGITHAAWLAGIWLFLGIADRLGRQLRKRLRRAKPSAA